MTDENDGNCHVGNQSFLMSSSEHNGTIDHLFIYFTLDLTSVKPIYPI